MAWTRTVVLAIWLAWIAVIFLALGFGIPFWLNGYTTHVNTNIPANSLDFVYYAGIWYSMACVEGMFSTCENKPIVPNTLDATSGSEPPEFKGTTAEELAASVADILALMSEWMGLQIIATVTLGFAALAVTILMCCRFAGIHSRGFFIFACLLMLVSGFGGIITVIIASVILGDMFSAHTSVTDVTTFPWSILLFVIGALVALATALLLMIITYKWYKFGHYYDSGEYHTWSDQDDTDNTYKNRSRQTDDDNYNGPSRWTTPHGSEDKNPALPWSLGDRNNTPSNRSLDRYGDDYRGYDNRGYDRDSDRGFDRGRVPLSRALPAPDRPQERDQDRERRYSFDMGSNRDLGRVRSNGDAAMVYERRVAPPSRGYQDNMYDGYRPTTDPFERERDRGRRQPYSVTQRVESRSPYTREYDRPRRGPLPSIMASSRSSLPRVHSRRINRTGSLRGRDQESYPYNFIQPGNQLLKPRSENIYRPFMF